MKAVKIDLAGREQYLMLTVEGMFQIDDAFGGSAGLIDAIRPGTREGFDAACRAAVILAEQGELARRQLGYAPAPIVDVETIRAAIAPSDLARLKLAIPAALSLGYGREVEPETNEIDLGLAELEAQKKTG